MSVATEIAFHFNVPQRVGYVCRLLRKAVSSGARLMVVGSADALQELDRDLWHFSSTDFLAHCDRSAPASLLQKSPIVLTDSPLWLDTHNVLINLDSQVPERFDFFKRVIEVVTQDASEKQDARERWMHYKSLGYPLVRHDYLQKTNS
jgi:DNA polymerase-3 subunit chi